MIYNKCVTKHGFSEGEGGSHPSIGRVLLRKNS